MSYVYRLDQGVVRQFCFRAGCREEPAEQTVPWHPEWQRAAGRERRKKSISGQETAGEGDDIWSRRDGWW